jgi:hypothetical protein
MNGLGLGKSIYTKKQLNQFVVFCSAKEQEGHVFRKWQNWHTIDETRRVSGA